MIALSPTNAEPAPGSWSFSDSPTSPSLGTCPRPSYHVTLTSPPAVRDVPGNVYTILDRFAQVSLFSGGASASIVRGAVSSSAMNTGSKMGHPKSPSCPVLKSCQARQFQG